MDPDLRKDVKFVKVCIDELKRVSREAGVKALPFAQVYKPGQGLLAGFDVPPSKVRQLRHNLNVIRGNPGMDFKTDPNGFVVAVPRKPAAERAAADLERAAAVAALESGTSSLFDKLLSSLDAGSKSVRQSTDGGTNSGKGASTSGTASSSASNGNGNGNGKQAVFDPAITSAKSKFLARYGHEYGYGGRLDDMYPSEVGCRMRPGEHYLDYTGSSVYCQSQLDAVFDELRGGMFGNPHSANPSSSMTSDRVEEVRDMVLKFFNGDPAEYQVVFTRSATGALQLVGETFPWGPGSSFTYLRENHNSVLGIREYALEHGGSFRAVNESFVERWLESGDCDPASAPTHLMATAAAAGSASAGECTEAQGTGGDADPALLAAVAQAQHGDGSGGDSSSVFNLFAFPGEDNFAGVKYPLRWIEQVHALSTPKNNWMVMLDAAAYVPTQPLDLAQVKPDFVAMSFYKMFGYPTGLGALLVRVDAAALLRKAYWGGGAVSLATSSDNFHVLKCRPQDRLEDGTVNFLDIIALKHGFSLIQKLGGIHAVRRHVAALTEWGFAQLSALKHSNGAPMLQIFGKHGRPDARQVQGGILNFEVLKPDGSVFSYKTFEQEAAKAGFHVRTGAECNPGACYAYLGVEEEEIEGLAGKKEGCHDDMEFIKVLRPVGSGEGAQQAQVVAAGGGKAVASSVQAPGVVEATSLTLGHPGEVAAQWVDVPLGSVRASLGYMSTFEDVYAFVKFIEKHYRDRT